MSHPTLSSRKKWARRKNRHNIVIALSLVLLGAVAFHSWNNNSPVDAAGETPDSISRADTNTTGNRTVTPQLTHAALDDDLISSQNGSVLTPTDAIPTVQHTTPKLGLTSRSVRENVSNHAERQPEDPTVLLAKLSEPGRSPGMGASQSGVSMQELIEPFYHKDFVEKFGISVTNSCVVSTFARARLKYHHIASDGFYKYLRRSGKLENYRARFGYILDQGRGGVLGGSDDHQIEENLYYVRNSRDSRMGYGLFAARDIPNGTILGEYGGKYALCDKVEVCSLHLLDWKRLSCVALYQIMSSLALKLTCVLVCLHMPHKQVQTEYRVPVGSSILFNSGG